MRLNRKFTGITNRMMSMMNFDGAMEDMNLMFSIGLVIANNDEMPKWTKEADFQRQ